VPARGGGARHWLCAAWLVVSLGAAWPQAVVALSASPYVEELTWTELRDRVAGGATTILVPIGGTEQNGPHMVLGKHNVRVRLLAGRIAQQLGNTLVAPVLAYVPEGAIDPPAAHMRFSGTISIGEATFESLLESAARSFRQHGFRTVVFIGEHGGYQKSLERLAARLDREWNPAPQAARGRPQQACRVHALSAYYQASQTAYGQALKARGFGAEEIGSHAGLADTALSLAVEPALVRQDVLTREPRPGAKDGVYGDPHRATAELGQLGADRMVEASVAAIRGFAGGR